MLAASNGARSCGLLSNRIITRCPNPTTAATPISTQFRRCRRSAHVTVVPGNLNAVAYGRISAGRSRWLTQFCRRAQ